MAISDIAIDFGGMFYQLAEKAPMTVVSPEQLAAREGERSPRQGRQGGKEAAPTEAPAGPTGEEIRPRSPARPEKAAKVRAAMEAKAKKAAAAARRRLAPRKRRSSQDSGPGSGEGREGARRHGSQGPKGRRGEGE
ncbi:MAG: hypothetical protein ACLUYK_02710 [Eggerthella lenta]